eukprot:9511553-Karenia_brevis.AAC.1
MGESGVEKMPNDKLYELMKKGNKVAAAFSNMCFDDDYRRNVGISQACDVLHKAINRMKTCPHTKA